MYYCILFTASSGGNYHFLYSKQGREKIIVNYDDTHYDTVSKHGTALNGYNWLKVPVGSSSSSVV